MSYIGNTSNTQNFTSGTDYFNGNGSTTAFTLSRSVSSINDVHAFIENVAQQPSTAYTVSGNTITFTSAPPTGTNNIYVRYQNLATQTIAPAQNTVSYSTLNTDLQGATYNFKNRIINGDMRIDQRNGGTSVTSTTDSYMVDRWLAQNNNTSGNHTFQQVVDAPTGFYNSFKKTSSGCAYATSGYNLVNQLIEVQNLDDFAYGTSSAQSSTLSFWVKTSVTGAHSIAVQNFSSSRRSYLSSYTVNSANTWEYKTLTIPGDALFPMTNARNSSGLMVRFSQGSGSQYSSSTSNSWITGDYFHLSGTVTPATTAGSTWQITGVQLEKGTTATNFDYRPYESELLMCQRYFWKIGGQNTENALSSSPYFPGAVVPLFKSSNSDYFIAGNYPVPMRTTATITTSLSSGTYDNAPTSGQKWTFRDWYVADRALGAMALAPETYGNRWTLRIGTTSANANATVIYWQGTSTAYIYFDAEI